MKFFLAVIAIRIILFLFLSNTDAYYNCFDSREYHHIAAHQEIYPPAESYLGYSNWYERTPAYTAFLMIFRENAILIQILMSVAGAWLLYRMNKKAGYAWALYPVETLHSIGYWKYSLLIFLIILAAYLLRDRNKIYTIAAVLILMIPFQSLIAYNMSISNGFMNNIWELWKPSFPSAALYSKYLGILMIIPYLILMFNFIRGIEFNYIVLLVIIYSVCYGLIYAHSVHREPLIPFLLLNYFKGNTE